MKFFHFGDVHLHNGSLFEEIKKCCLYVLDKVKEEKPNLITIPGDIFDLLRDNEGLRIGSPATLFAIDFVIDLADIAPVLIDSGTSTHDPKDSVTLLSRFQGKNPVHTAATLQQVMLIGNEFVPLNTCTEEAFSQLLAETSPRAVISCLPSVTKAGILAQSGLTITEGNRTTEELLRDVFQMWGIMNKQAREYGIPTIFTGHCTVKGSVTSTGQKMIGKDLEIGVADLKLARCDIYCLDHIHKAQQINASIFYSGSITRLDHGETEEKGFYIHEFPGDGPVVSRFVTTPARVMKTLSTDGIPDESILDGIAHDDIVRIKYSIREDQLSAVDEQALRKAALEKGASDVQFDKEVISIQRTRAEGISRLNSIEEKLLKWGEASSQEITQSLTEKLNLLTSTELPDIFKSYSSKNHSEVGHEAKQIAA